MTVETVEVETVVREVVVAAVATTVEVSSQAVSVAAIEEPSLPVSMPGPVVIEVGIGAKGDRGEPGKDGLIPTVIDGGNF